MQDFLQLVQSFGWPGAMFVIACLSFWRAVSLVWKWWDTWVSPRLAAAMDAFINHVNTVSASQKRQVEQGEQQTIILKSISARLDDHGDLLDDHSDLLKDIQRCVGSDGDRTTKDSARRAARRSGNERDDTRTAGGE